MDALTFIRKYYGTTRAKRSGVPLINHILEGITLLDYFGDNFNSKEAFCLHPILQEGCFNRNTVIEMLDCGMDWSVCLALEYRNIANQYLSTRLIQDISEIVLSPLEEVNNMLRADKVQNYKDFLMYHQGVHPRSEELNTYFNNWFQRLEVDYIKAEEYLKYNHNPNRDFL